jgi:hypothetical protein
MRPRYLGSCSWIEKVLGRAMPCCSSCHSDDEGDYSPLGEIDSPDSKSYFTVCCTTGHELTDDDCDKLWSARPDSEWDDEPTPPPAVASNPTAPTSSRPSE